MWAPERGPRRTITEYSYQSAPMNEIFDALCPPSGRCICPFSSMGLPMIQQNAQWRELVERECGGVPEKAVHGCKPHYDHRHALKDHAQRQKMDEDDDDDNEASTLHRLLYKHLNQSISVEDQVKQLKRQLQGQHNEGKQKEKVQRMEHAAEIADERDKRNKVEERLKEESKLRAELHNDMQLARQQLQAQITNLERKCEAAEQAARSQIQAERHKTQESLSSFTKDLQDGLYDSIREDELTRQRMERERELTRQRELAAQKQVSEERLRNAQHEQACLKDVLAEKERQIRELQDAQDRRVNAVVHAVREEEQERANERAKELEAECRTLQEQVENRQDEVELLEDQLNPLMVHANVLASKIDALHMLAVDMVNFYEEYHEASQAREKALQEALKKAKAKAPALPGVPSFPLASEKAVKEIKDKDTRKLEQVIHAAESAVKGMPLARAQKAAKTLGIVCPIASKEEALMHIGTHLRGTTQNR